MFVAVVSDVSTDDHRLAVQYGFDKVMKDLHKSTSITDTAVTRLKHDIDRANDFYDTVRLPQDTLLIISRRENKWRQLVSRTE